MQFIHKIPTLKTSKYQYEWQFYHYCENTSPKYFFFFLVKSQEFIATKVICYIHVFHSYKIRNFMETKIFYKYRKNLMLFLSHIRWLVSWETLFLSLSTYILIFIGNLDTKWYCQYHWTDFDSELLVSSDVKHIMTLPIKTIMSALKVLTFKNCHYFYIYN